MILIGWFYLNLFKINWIAHENSGWLQDGYHFSNEEKSLWNTMHLFEKCPIILDCCFLFIICMNQNMVCLVSILLTGLMCFTSFYIYNSHI